MVSWEELLGLVGIAIVISVGKVFDTLRVWLRGFIHPFNPLRILGELISCSMCSGWWVGFFWGLYLKVPYGVAILIGGMVSVSAYMVDSMMAFFEGLMRRLIRPPTSSAPPFSLPPPNPKIKKIHPGQAISEREAHALLDEDDDPNWAKDMMSGKS